MFNSQSFSRELKIQKLNYKLGEEINHELIASHLLKLNKFNLKTLKSDAEKKAFWINTYNGLTNYLIIDLKIKKSMKESTDIFKGKHIKIDNIPFSLDDIEHGILRKNARKHLSENDEILNYQVDKLDYRIHFSLNCGAESCPMIAFYTTENIEEELRMAENSFVTAEFEINSQTKEIRCSSLFEWYKDDFDKRFTENPIFADYSVITKDYNWNI
jgi:hypothetical protein